MRTRTAALLAGLALAAPALADARWETEGRTGGRTGTAPVDAQPPYVPVWKAGVGPAEDGRGGLIEHGVAVAGGRVYSTTLSGWTGALNALSGGLLWRRDLGDNFATAPTYHRGYVYVNGRRPGILWKLNARSGRTAWRRCYSASSCTYISEGAPLVVGSAVYVTVTAAGRSSFLAAFGLDGRRLWTRRACGSHIFQPPTWTGRYVVHGDVCGYVRAYTPRGRLAWTRRLYGNMHAAMTKTRGRLYGHTRAGLLYALSPHTGRILWTRRTGSGVGYPNCAATPRTVWCANGWGDNALTAWNRDGRRLWRQRLPGEVMGAVSLTSRMLWVATYGENRYILGLNPRTGRERVRFPHGFYDPIAASGRTIYLLHRATIEAVREGA